MRDSGRGERPRVVYWFNQPTPYAVARFNAVSDRGEVDLEAWFNEVRQADRSWQVDPQSWRFPARYIPVRSLFGLRLRVPLAELLTDPPDLFVCEYDRLNLAAGAAAARASARRVAFRVLPNYDAWSNRTWWREVAKHLLFRSVDGAKVPGPDGAKLASRYGIPADRISCVTQSIAVAHYARAVGMAAGERERRRRALNMQGCVFIFVGRLWSGKGLDELFAAYRRLSVAERRADVSLLVVGDGAEEERYRSIARALPRVSFAGFVQPSELPEWYALADCLVLPTHGDPNGLVVEEAFAAGLPVICSDAAGDIRRRLPSGKAGFVFPVGSEPALSDCMRHLANDAALRSDMAAAAKVLATARTDERYAADFARFVSRQLETPRRTGCAASATTLLGRGLLAAARLLRWPAAPHERPRGLT